MEVTVLPLVRAGEVIGVLGIAQDVSEGMKAETQPALAANLIFITGGAFTPRARAYLRQVDNLWLEKPFDAARLKKLVTSRLHEKLGRT